MKRKLFGLVAAAAAIGSVGAMIPAQAAHAEPQIIQVCVTLQGRFIGITINGVPVGFPIDGTPRTCVGI